MTKILLLLGALWLAGCGEESPDSVQKKVSSSEEAVTENDGSVEIGGGTISISLSVSPTVGVEW